MREHGYAIAPFGRMSITSMVLERSGLLLDLRCVAEHDYGPLAENVPLDLYCPDGSRFDSAMVDLTSVDADEIHAGDKVRFQVHVLPDSANG